MISPISSKYCVTSKSPLTGIFGMSIAGGYFGSELRRSGWAGVVVKGRAEKPSYVAISDGKVRIERASDIWGMNTDETQKMIREKMGDEKARVACIGPAGENLVKFACIISDKRAAGRCGLGAVMGSKNLKAIAVRGTEDVTEADPEAMKEVSTEVIRILVNAPYPQTLSRLGTSNTLMMLNEIGALPTRNFQTGIFEFADSISAERLKEEFRVGKADDEPSCPVLCAMVNRVDHGVYQGSISEGPDYETLYALGTNCGNSCLESIIHADMLCDQLGLDTMSAGGVIGFAMECYEKGILTKDKTDGIELKFGNHEAIIETIKRISRREGFGETLAEGVRACAELFGGNSKRFAMHVKGLELGGYDPRGVKGMGLSFATCTRGGCHHSGGYTVADELHKYDRFATEGKAGLVKRARNTRIVYDSAMLCALCAGALGLDVPSKLIKAAIGMDANADSLLAISEKIANTEREINVREGMTRTDDTLPPRLLEEPMPEGSSKGQTVELDKMLDDYYKITGWK